MTPEELAEIAATDAMIEESLAYIENNGVTSLFKHSDGVRAIEHEIRRAERPSITERWAYAQIVAHLFGWLLSTRERELEEGAARAVRIAHLRARTAFSDRWGSFWKCCSCGRRLDSIVDNGTCCLGTASLTGYTPAPWELDLR